jgi:nicotinate-nucleotide adenylyltransferase
MIRALLGGSFDPFHNGHLAIVNALLSRRLADRVLVVPAYRSPHKKAPAVEGRHRLQMARLALADVAAAEVSSLELERGGVSYTIETVEELIGQEPGDAIRLVLGADSVQDFFRWRSPERILELVEIVVFARPGCPQELPAEIAARAHLVSDFAVPVSATQVRAALTAGRQPVEMVPAAVLAYIAAHTLYGG